MSLPQPDDLIAELRALPSGASLGAAVLELACAAAQRGAQLEGIELDMATAAAETPYGNVQSILQSGPANPEQRQLLAALCGLGLGTAEHPELSVPDVLWLASHAGVDTFAYVDLAVGPRASSFWVALRALLHDPEAIPRAESLVAASALAHSGSAAAQRARAELRGTLRDTTLLRLLEQPAASAKLPRLVGEFQPAPRHPVWTLLFGITGLLMLWQLLRLSARFVLAYKHPAQLRVSARGLEISHHTEILGRTLRQAESLVPLANLGQVTREVKYARAGLYAGLGALSLGTYLGTGLFIDGSLVPGFSPSLLGLATVFVLLGLLLDFGLSSLSDSMRSRCRLVITQRTGRRLCIGSIDATGADTMLGSLADQIGAA